MKSIYLGTEVWLDHFSKQFTSVQSPWIGFNILDDHRNDAFILENIDEKLEDESIDIIVVHFVKLDHGGHSRLGISVPDRFEKYTKGIDKTMNAFMDKIEQHDVMVLAFGDHGQNNIGGHSGAGEEETSSVMFFTQKEPFMSTQKNRININQLELTSTFTNLLDTKLPYSNLGTFIPELLQYESETTEKG